MSLTQRSETLSACVSIFPPPPPTPRGNLYFYQLSREVTADHKWINQRELARCVLLSLTCLFFCRDHQQMCVAVCVHACVQNWMWDSHEHMTSFSCMWEPVAPRCLFFAGYCLYKAMKFSADEHLRYKRWRWLIFMEHCQASQCHFTPTDQPNSGART